MATEIDDLQIRIEAEATKANTSIDLLADKLDRLYTSLGRIDGTRMRSLASGVSQLASSVKGFASIDGRTFTALAKNIDKIANINSSGVGNSATAITSIATAFNQLGNVSQASQNMATLVSSISKLGNKGVTNAIVNIPQLANSMNQLMVTLSKAPTINKSVIDMTNALANLASQGSKVGYASSSVVNGLNRTNAAAKRASGSTMSLARAFGKFYANYFLLVRGFKGMFNMMESAMELTETVNYFEVTLNNIGENARENWKKYGYESADAYADSFAERLRESNEKLTGFTVSETGQISQSVFSGLGISPATATQYSAMFAQVANSIGMTEEASIALSEAFVRLGADWASLRNVDFGVAYEKLASGLSGQSRALRAFGIDITMASLQEIAFANGIEKSVSEMTQSEKAYLRLIAIIEQSEVAFGDLANTLASPANQMRMLSQGIQNLGTLIGNLFLPLLQRVLPVLNGFVIALQRIVIAISETMGIDTSGFNTSLGGMDEGFGDLSDSVDEATESAEKFNRATRGWDELNVLGKDTSKGYGVGNDLVENEQLLDAYDDAIEKYRKAWNEAYERINNEAEGFANKILEGIDIKEIGRNVSHFANSLKELGEALLPFLGGFASGFSETTLSYIDTILGFFAGMLENVDPKDATAVGEGIGKIAAGILAFKGITSGITGLTSAIGTLKSLGMVMSANPILLFAGGVGVAALDLATKINEIGKIAFSHESFVDEIERGNKEIDAQTEAFLERAEASKKASEMPSELESVYERWKEIANKVGELSDEDSGLLVQYAKRIKELLPEAEKYIGENGLAYAGVADELDALIEKQLKLYRVQAMETHVKNLMQVEIEMEYNLKDLKKERNKVFEDIVKELAPEMDITKHPLYDLLPEVEFQNKVLEDIKKAYEKRLDSAEVSLFDMEALAKVRSEYQTAVDSMQTYKDRQTEIIEQETAYKDVQTQLSEAIGGLVDAQNNYNTVADDTEQILDNQSEKIENLREETENVVSTMYDVAEETTNTAKKIQVFADSANDAKISLDNLYNSVKNFKSDKIELPSISSIEKAYSNSSFGSLNPSQFTSKSSYSLQDEVSKAVVNMIPLANNVNVTFDVKGDPNGLFTVVQQKATQYTKSTGRNAFGY